MTYYNTNGETGSTLKTSQEKAKTQEELVLEYFRRYPEDWFSPFDIQHVYKHRDYPITSIRRAITNLTKKGYLTKLNKFKPGAYNKMNHVWKLRDE